MTKFEKIILLTAGGLAALTLMVTGSGSYMDYLRPFLEKWEQFSATPYWDVSRWSWGYGTQAPGPTGSIDRATAWNDAAAHAAADKAYLAPLLSVALNPRQWAALLSFSYQEGPGNADNLIKNLNAQDLAALQDQWKKYIYVGGEISPNSVARRAAEWDLFTS